LGYRIYLAAVIGGLALAPAMIAEVGGDVLRQHLLRLAEDSIAPRRRPLRETCVKSDP
jgi:hypothetical protein